MSIDIANDIISKVTLGVPKTNTVSPKITEEKAPVISQPKAGLKIGSTYEAEATPISIPAKTSGKVVVKQTRGSGYDRDGFWSEYKELTFDDGSQMRIKSDNTPFLSERDVSTETKNEIRGGSFEDTQKEVDHLISIGLGGTNAYSNLQALKSDRSITEKFYDMITGKFPWSEDYKAETRQEGKYMVEVEAIDKYRSGDITLWEAIGALEHYDEPKIVASFLHKDKEENLIEKGAGLLNTLHGYILGENVDITPNALAKQATDFIDKKIQESRRTGIINDIVGKFGVEHYIDLRPGEALIAEIGEGMDKETVLKPGPRVENLNFFQAIDGLSPNKLADEVIRYSTTEPTKISSSLQAKIGVQGEITKEAETPTEVAFAAQPAWKKTLITGTAPIRFTAGSLSRLAVSYGLELTGADLKFTPQTEWQEYLMGKEDFERLANSADIYGEIMRITEDRLLQGGIKSDNARVGAMATVLLMGAVIENPFLSFGKKPAKEAIEIAMREGIEKELKGELSEKALFEISEEAGKIAGLTASVEKEAAIKKVINKYKNPSYLKEAPLYAKDEIVEKEVSELNKVLDKKEVKPVADSMAEANKQLSLTNLDPKNASLYLRTKQFINDKLVRLTEAVQNDWIRVKNLVETTGSESDPFAKKVLFPGRVQTRIENVNDTTKSIVKERMSFAKAANIDDITFKKNVNDFLISQHAPERNKAIGEKASGITTEEAEKKMAELEKLPYFNEIKKIANEIEKLNKQTLEVLYDSQVISADLYNTLIKKYKHHVPLNRVFEEGEDIVDILTTRGLDVKGTGIRSARGSEREVQDILGNVTTNAQEAIVRAEKNRVDLEMLKFARENKDLELFKEVKPKAIGKKLQTKKEFVQKGEELLFDTKLYNDPTVLTMKENGKTVFLKINDRHLATIIKGLGREKVPSYLKYVSKWTRFYSGMATRFNPDFAFSNKIRDLQETLTYIASQKEMGFRGAQKVLTKDLQSTKDIIDFLRGVDTEGTRLYKEMRMEGGTTGGMGLSTREQVMLDLEKIEKTMQSNPRKAVKKLIDGIDNWNMIFEDSTRLSVYKSSLEKGLSKEKATVLAKQASIDFNQMGTLGPVVNSVWMFSNASLQGSFKMIRAMKNPKVAAAVIAAVGGAVYTTSEWNDKLDPEWRDKVSKYDRTANLIVVLPPNSDGNFRYITIPVSWGVRPIKVAADYTYDFATDYEKDIGNAFKGVLAALIEGYNPIGGTDIYSALTPTIGDIPSELVRNKAWTGNKIKPDWNQNLPQSRQYYNSLTNSQMGDMLVKGTKILGDEFGIEISPADVNYVYEQLIGGAGRFVNKVVNTISSIGKGEKPEARNVPITSRFLKTRTEEELNKFGTEMEKAEDVKKLLNQQEKEKFDRSQVAETLYKEMSAMGSEEANNYWLKINESDAELANMIKTLKEEADLGLSYTEKQIKQLGVENGGRASYIYDELMALENDTERRELWNNYVDKKIITKKVSEQLYNLFQK